MKIDQNFEKQLIEMGFFDEETRCDTLISKETKKLWAIELDILREFQRVCAKYSLTYFADSGTLLGAIRHKGFIPWDDDIDIVMPRKDFNILVSVAAKEFMGNYCFLSPYHQTEYPRNHAQIINTSSTMILKEELGRYSYDQGIFMDVFPLDTVPEKKVSFNLYMVRCYWLMGLRRVKYAFFGDAKLSKKRVLLSKIVGPLIRKKWVSYKRYEAHCSKYSGIEHGLTEKFTFRAGHRKQLYHMKHEWYSENSNVDFEMLKISIPQGYDNVLKSFYGAEYMTPKNSASLHGCVIIDVDVSYNEWVKKGTTAK